MYKGRQRALGQPPVGGKAPQFPLSIQHALQALEVRFGEDYL